MLGICLMSSGGSVCARTVLPNVSLHKPNLSMARFWKAAQLLGTFQEDATDRRWKNRKTALSGRISSCELVPTPTSTVWATWHPFGKWASAQAMMHPNLQMLMFVKSSLGKVCSSSFLEKILGDYLRNPSETLVLSPTYMGKLFSSRRDADAMFDSWRVWGMIFFPAWNSQDATPKGALLNVFC